MQKRLLRVPYNNIANYISAKQSSHSNLGPVCERMPNIGQNQILLVLFTLLLEYLNNILSSKSDWIVLFGTQLF